MQIALFVLLPTILLTGFVFPRETMPWIVQQLGWLIPLTYYLQILRGVIVKGVGTEVLWPQVVALTVFAVVALGVSVARFRKTIE